MRPCLHLRIALAATAFALVLVAASTSVAQTVGPGGRRAPGASESSSGGSGTAGSPLKAADPTPDEPPPIASQREPSAPEPVVSGVVLPTALVTPETGFAVGAFAAFFFKTEPNSPNQRTSNLPFGALYSVRNQFIAGMIPELFFDGNRLQFVGDFRFQRFPALFYGRGQIANDNDEERFTLQSVQIHPEVRRNIVSSLYFGIRFDFDQTTIDDATGPKLTSGKYVGERGGIASGIGPSIVWDSRDNQLYPRSGDYHQMAAVFFGPGLGSDFSFIRAFLDLRHYIGTLPGQVLAFNGYLGVTAGAPPFYLLQLLGGSSQLRGYYEGRFRDNEMALLQAEYRARLFWRVGGAAFFGVGQVAQRIDQLGDPTNLRPAGGAGLRFTVSEREGFSVRADLGVSENGVLPYVLFKEAF